MEHWVSDFDSWMFAISAVATCSIKPPGPITKAIVWSDRDEEFVKRASFALMAYLASHDKKAPDSHSPNSCRLFSVSHTDDRNCRQKGG